MRTNKLLSLFVGLAALTFFGSATVAGDKVDVCHKDKVINVSVNALAAHLAHGDIEGTCQIGAEFPGK